MDSLIIVDILRLTDESTITRGDCTCQSATLLSLIFDSKDGALLVFAELKLHIIPWTISEYVVQLVEDKSQKQL